MASCPQTGNGAAVATSQEDAVSICEAFLGKHGASGTVLFSMLAGSISYNLAHEASDKDYKGVYLAPTEAFFGIELPPQTVTVLPEENSLFDVTVYEARRFCTLLQEGDPFALEMVLASPRLCYQSAAWRELLLLVPRLLTRRAFGRCVTYARSQLEKFLKGVGKGKAPPGKRFYHIVRILWMAKDIVAGLVPRIWLEEGERRALLVDIRADRFSAEQLKDMAEQLLAVINGVSVAMLPAEVQPGLLEDWLMRARLRSLPTLAEATFTE
jgi:predicted nucleotidyltransferase